MTIIRAARVFDGERLYAPGHLEVDGARVVACGPADDRVADVDLGDAILAPGFVDAHGHGGGGASYPDDPRAALDAHLRHGTTTAIASLVTQSLDALEAQLRTLAPLVEAGELGGVHLEGPWLSPARKGAHPADRLLAPTASDVDRLLDAAAGTVRMVTIAPELPGGLDAVARVVDRGIVAAVGHTEADLATCRQAFAAGATGSTHLFNAMPGLHHRHPGPVLAALESGCWLELIADGVHVDLGLIAYVAARHPERLVLVTDAMAAAGAPDGDYHLGDLPVSVEHAVARLADGSLAGSTLTLDRALANTIGAGVPLEVALAAVTSHPADYLGLQAGRLAPGSRFDAVALDADWSVTQVWRAGRPYSQVRSGELT